MISQNSREEVAIAARNLVIRAQELCTRRGYAAAEKLYQLELVQRNFGSQHLLLSEVLECCRPTSEDQSAIGRFGDEEALGTNLGDVPP